MPIMIDMTGDSDLNFLVDFADFDYYEIKKDKSGETLRLYFVKDSDVVAAINFANLQVLEDFIKFLDKNFKQWNQKIIDV